MKNQRIVFGTVLWLGLTLSLSSPNVAAQESSLAAVPASVQALPGFTIRVFAQAPGLSSKPPQCEANSPSCYTKPDSLVQMGRGAGSSIFIAYQDGLKPDGAISDSNKNMGQVQIVQYDLNGKALKTYTVAGHNDGLLAYDSHTLWALSNEDSNPILSVIDTSSNTVQTYTADATPAHGGGYDDLQKIGNQVYVSASNPSANPSGAYSQAAVVSLSLNPDGKTFHVVAVLMGNAPALDIPSNTTIPLGPNKQGLSDPDSEAVDPSGNLVLDSQGDSVLVFISNPGPNQTIKQLPLSLYGNPWPVDDTRWVPSGASYMLVSDTKAGLIYRVDRTQGFSTGDMYSAGQGTLLSGDSKTGNLTPVIIGLNAPHGLIFVQH